MVMLIGNRMRARLTCRLMMECIPLHHTISNIAADKVLAVAQENPVPDRVNIRRREVGNASVAGVLAVIWRTVAQKLLADLHSSHVRDDGQTHRGSSLVSRACISGLEFEHNCANHFHDVGKLHMHAQYF